MRTPIEKALWFIEGHFARDIGLDEIAQLCGLSRFQMSRLFSHATGTSVTAYSRGRRLTEAARILAQGASDILQVALSAGYGSHEAFSRAFRDQFGLTPSEVRARRTVDGLALVEPQRYHQRVRIDLPSPRIEIPGPMLLAGIGRRFDIGDFAGIPALWQDLRPHIGMIRGQLGNSAFGLVTETAAHTDSYFYIAGVRVLDPADLDRALTKVLLPARRWQAYAHHGHVTTIASTIDAIFARRSPQPSTNSNQMPDLLERYGRNFDPDTGNGGCDIWVPAN